MMIYVIYTGIRAECVCMKGLTEKETEEKLNVLKETFRKWYLPGNVVIFVVE